ncbi:MAG: ATP-binding protein [Acidimicrobiia bacterium]
MVMLTGMGDSEVDSAAMQAGAADYVVKGIIGADTLERILRHAIERSAGWRRIVEAEAKQLAMMKGIPDTVLRVSPDGVVLGYRAGVTSDPADGPVTENITLAETFGDRIAATVMNAVKTTLMSGGASSCEFTREGMFMMRSFEARVVAIEDANEAVVIIRDVTDERAAARRLDDLAQANDRFLARISHDLRTPLATVLGYADLLGSEWSEFIPEERGEMIDAVASAVMHGGPRREIVVGQAGAISWVEVRDDGVGIQDDERAWIFDPSDRSSHSLDNGASTGVGLAVSRELVHLMEGDLTYHRESGWTTFRLEFPAASAPDGSEFGERTEAGGSSIVAASVGAAGEPRRRCHDTTE